MATSPATRRETAPAPIYYADQPAALAINGQVCRLTFGVSDDDGSNFPRHVVTVAIPTDSLLRMVNDLKRTFDDPDFKKQATELLQSAARAIAAGGHDPSKPVQRARKPAK